MRPDFRVSRNILLAVGDPNTIELVLLAIPPSGTTTAEVAARAGMSEELTRHEIDQLALARQVEVSQDRVRLTSRGEATTASLRRQFGLSTTTAPREVAFDLDAVAELVEKWTATRQRRAAAQEAARHELLASDADRDAVTHLLANAFAQGRLTHGEFDARTSRTLRARTHGELDDVLAGLGGLPGSPVPARPLRRVVFWLMVVLTSPFLLLGGFATAFGSDLGDRVFGIVLLVLFLPGLLALRRWAPPRSS